MAEGSKQHRSISSKKEAPPMYQSEDFLRVKKQLIQIGGGELVQDISMMIKYGMEVRQASRGTSDKRQRQVRPSWEVSHASHDKEKRRRLQILSQPNTLLSAANQSSIRAAHRMREILEASSSFNANHPSDHVKSTIDKADYSQIISSQYDRNESSIGREGAQKLPKLSQERKQNKARMRFLGDLERSDDSDRHRQRTDHNYEDAIDMDSQLQKEDTITNIHSKSNLPPDSHPQKKKHQLTIPFIGEVAEDQMEKSQKFSTRQRTELPGDLNSDTEQQVSKRKSPNMLKLNLKDRRDSQSSLENMEPTLRSVHMNTHKHSTAMSNVPAGTFNPDASQLLLSKKQNSGNLWPSVSQVLKSSPGRSRSTRNKDTTHNNPTGRSSSNSNNGSNTVSHAASKFIQILKHKKSKDMITDTTKLPFLEASHLEQHFKKQTQTNSSSNRKEAAQVLDFVDSLLPSLQGYQSPQMSQMLQEIIKFSEAQLVRMLKAERRDFYDLFSKITELKQEERLLMKRHLKQMVQSLTQQLADANNQLTDAKAEIQTLKEQNEMLSPKKKSSNKKDSRRQGREDASRKRNSIFLKPLDKGDQSTRRKTIVGKQDRSESENSKSHDDSEQQEGGATDQMTFGKQDGKFVFPTITGLTGTAKTAVEALKSELEMTLRKTQLKERDFVAKLNNMQKRLEQMKNINLGLIEKYNTQNEKLNRFKHRLIFHIRKVDPNSDMLNDEEMIDMDMVKALEQNNLSMDNNSMLSGAQEGHEAPIETVQPNKNKPQNQGGMEAIEQQDKFDYNIIYRRRHITKKSHSQRKNPKAHDTESKHIKYYKRLVRTTIAGTDTKGLVPLRENSTQTVISLCDKKFDHFLQNQYDVELLSKRATFEKEIEGHLHDHRRMCFLNDGIMRRLLLLTLPNSQLTDYEVVPIEQSELAKELKDHEISFHTTEDDYNEKLKRANIDTYFRLEMLDDYMNHRLKLPVTATDTILKYVFLSYIFAAYSGKKKTETIQRKEDQVSLLFKLCRQYRQKLLEYDTALKKSQDNFQTFIQIHRGCGISHITNDFKFERATTSTVMNDHMPQGGHSASVMISNIINRIKKLKVVMKSVNKKYFSLKVIYQKVYGFFQTRSSEVEFLHDSNKVKHTHNMEEHFFRYLTERENGVKKIEEKIKNFIITVFNMDYNPKVEMLMRFMNLAKEMPFTKSEEFYYLRLIEYIKTESRGLDVPVEAHKGTNYIPFDKLELFLNKYIMWKLNPKIQAQIFKEMKEETLTSYEGVSKKGIIDIDTAMLIVFKYINTKITYPYSKEYSFSLYELLDLDNIDGLTFTNFVDMYSMFNLDYYGEATRLLAKVKHPKLKKELTLDEMLEQVGARPDAQMIEKPWMEKNYIYSSNQLKEIFCKFTKQEFKEDQEPTQKLEAFPFHEMINEYENLFDFEKIYGFLGIQGAYVETEFYTAIMNFKKNQEGFARFIDSCLVKDDDWKDLFRRKLTALQFIFGNSKQFEDAVKAYADALVENNIESMDEDKRRSNVMLKSLLLYKIFQLELLKADFEQRFDYAQLEELPFN